MSATVQLPPEFAHAMALLPNGAIEGEFRGRRWGVTVRRSQDRRRVWLFAEQRGGAEIVSFNLYELSHAGSVLKPCEMSSSKVIDFVLGFRYQLSTGPLEA